MPRNQFVKEHKNLLGVLKRGKRSELDAEYADQAKELKAHGGTRNSGFIQRMMGEVKQFHDGEYKPIKRLAKDSTMNAPRVFSYGKVKTPSKWLQTTFGKAKAPAVAPAEAPAPAPKKRTLLRLPKKASVPAEAKPDDISEVAKQNKARRDRQHTEERYIQPYKRTIEKIKYYGQPENWRNLTTKEKATFYQQIYDLDYIQKQVPEVGANPYPNADSLPYVLMSRAYKAWLKKNNLSDKPSPKGKPKYDEPDMATLGQYHHAKKKGLRTPAMKAFETKYKDFLEDMDFGI